MDSVLSELQCPVCLELYQCPTILPCSHMLCRTPCAQRLFVEDFIRCPVCRENCFVTGGIEVLPRVISLEHIIEHIQNSPNAPGDESQEEPQEEDDTLCVSPTDIPCQLCPSDAPQRRATKSCLHCNASYCSKCLEVSHPDREPFNQHHLVDPRRYPKPKELRCPQHHARVNIFCRDCQVLGCLLCADDPGAHPGHHVQNLDEATADLKVILEKNLVELTSSLEAAQEAATTQHQQHRNFQVSIQTRRQQINQECDGLVNEIEMRRQFFLSDLEYEEHSQVDSQLRLVERQQAQQSGLRSLVHFTREVLKETDQCAFLQLAKAVNDRMKKCVESLAEVRPASPASTVLDHKVVDLRKERAVLRDMTYLVVPNTPMVETERCCKSTHSVVLVLSAPLVEHEVIDSYKVYFGTEEQKASGSWDTMEFKTPGEERKCGRSPTCHHAVCLIHDNLRGHTIYYFKVGANNSAGESLLSAVTSCTTLSESQTTVPVPKIDEGQCRAYSYSIQIHSPSPEAVDGDKVKHYLLYRECSVNKIWKSIVLVGRADHRVFGLESDTMYDFVIMATDEDGECQVSNMVTLRTERSAY